MGIRVYDNYEDDGQLSLFGLDEDEWNFTKEPAESSAREGKPADNGPDIRVRRCASCGKLLFVKEENDGYRSSCNNCGIEYFQKI